MGFPFFFANLIPSDFELPAFFFFAGCIDVDIAFTIARVFSGKRLLRSIQFGVFRSNDRRSTRPFFPRRTRQTDYLL
jgi:hypothetical protein